ncbi:MAG: hypothetical protein H7Y41_05975, partial [Hyphomonadaceae bacterium]|nr:hypothetical protein [Clostridia bacterium]
MADAERQMLAFFPDYMELTQDQFPIACICAQGANIGTLSHRDFLGALLALGIKRERVGDILVGENEAHLFVDQELCTFVLQSLTKVGRENVSLARIPIGEVLEACKKYVEITATVMSLRLDAVLSVALKMSRTKVVPLIQSERVQVNWQVQDSVSHTLAEGDMLSVKGYGRLQLFKIGGLSKKGRSFITIHRFE